MAALSAEKTEGKPLYIVTEPSALAERVVSKERLNDQTIRLETGQEVEVVALEKQLRALGFQEVDYVYEPGQFAVRGSILDVYSYSSEYPFRIDFFGDESTRYAPLRSRRNSRSKSANRWRSSPNWLKRTMSN